MKFGQKLKAIRESKKVSQQELARRLGYKTNSYVSDVEKGRFIPSMGKLKEIARALGVPFAKIKDSLLESKLEEIGIKDPALVGLIRDYPRLTNEDKNKISELWLKMVGKRT